MKRFWAIGFFLWRRKVDSHNLNSRATARRLAFGLFSMISRAFANAVLSIRGVFLLNDRPIVLRNTLKINFFFVLTDFGVHHLGLLEMRHLGYLRDIFCVQTHIIQNMKDIAIPTISSCSALNLTYKYTFLTWFWVWSLLFHEIYGRTLSSKYVFGLLRMSNASSRHDSYATSQYVDRERESDELIVQKWRCANWDHLY